jgi:formate-dependent nitrite reductase membrane component NrfD
MDPKVNGQLQEDWNWLVAIYLFLGGVGAGAYTIAAINSFIGEGAELSTAVGLWIGFPALLIGSLCLVADLGSPTRAVLAGMKPKTSWIARGFWIISAFMILAFGHLVLYLTDGPAQGVVAVAGIVFAVGTMAYTGILLGASKGIPFWRSGVVPVVFVVSALVTSSSRRRSSCPIRGNPRSESCESPRSSSATSSWVWPRRSA